MFKIKVCPESRAHSLITGLAVQVVTWLQCWTRNSLTGCQNTRINLFLICSGLYIPEKAAFSHSN